MSGHLVDEDVRTVEQFLYREAALLDARDYPGWLGLLTEDCTTGYRPGGMIATP